MKTIFPASIVQHTAEYYLARISVRSKAIYLGANFMVVSALFSLPFIQVDVAVQAHGAFRTSLSRNGVTSLVGGRIAEIHMRENMPVTRGDVLATVRTETVELEINGILERRSQLRDFISDLRKLVVSGGTAGAPVSGDFSTRAYQSGYYEYRSTLAGHRSVLRKERRDYDRALLLYESRTIPFAEFDEARMEYMQAESVLEIFQKRKTAEWEQELAENRKELAGLNNRTRLLEERLDQYRIVAGVSGTLMGITDLRPGDFVYPNQRIGEISPDTGLIAVVNLSPADIGFVKKGQKVFFQVDAYNYNQWGLAEGTVTGISGDVLLVSGSEAVFRVVCRLDRAGLRLKNGTEGKIKKGMTFNSRFVIARRSLFQLLYDKVDDWLNPAVR